MAYLRIVLIVISMVATLVLFGMLKHSWKYRSEEITIMLVILGLIGLNMIYLTLVKPSKPIGLFGRFPRMFRLWLDAKEADLKRRSTQSAD